MNYFLYKLKFLTPVHFGESNSAQSLVESKAVLCADTLFSALCHTALQMQDSGGPEQLYQMAKQGLLRLSDAFPWKNETLYLPRPFMEPSVRSALPADNMKLLKKLKYLPLDAYKSYIAGLASGTPPDPAQLSCSFGTADSAVKAALQDGEDTLPYTIGLFRFFHDCGLYFIAGLENDSDFALLSRLVSALGVGGIGGKTSSGYGSFDVTEAGTVKDQVLLQGLSDVHADRQVSLTTSLPCDDELEQAMDGASFQLVRRSGFVSSPALPRPRKKEEQVFLASGSVFGMRYCGDVWNVAPAGCHPVYRYGIPVFWGVTL